MKRLVATQVVIALALLLGYGNAVAGSSVGSLAKNKVYSVQIIAHDTCPAGSFDDTSRRSIAVLAGFTDSIPDGTLLKDTSRPTRSSWRRGPITRLRTATPATATGRR
jgi:hypothetical protein